MMLKPLTSYSLSLLALLIQWLNQLASKPKRRHSVPQRSSDRAVTLSQGVGAGLKFQGDHSNSDYASGTYELPLQKAIARVLKPGDVFYDIGANIGFFTVIGAKLVGPTGSVYAFEPVPENVARIRRNIRLNRFAHVTAIQKAVSGATGKGELLLAHHSGGATLSRADSPPDFRGTMPVNLVSIDELVAHQTLKPPTVVKVDVEGAEIEVFQGMTKTLKEFKPVIVYEVDDRDRDAFNRKYQALERLLNSLGYTITPLEAAYPASGWHVGHALALASEGRPLTV